MIVWGIKRSKGFSTSPREYCKTIVCCLAGRYGDIRHWMEFAFVAFFVSFATSEVGLYDLFCHLLYAVPVAVSAFINIYILYVIGSICDSIRHGSSPFTMHTSRQIKVVSFLLLVSFVLQAVVSVIPFDGYSLGVMRIGLAKQGDGVVADLSISTLVASAIGFVLSYVFKYGALLQRLSDDTV